ncbi:class A beta-lactamase, subclass A2 [Pseudochryseolinea flava]|uniref:beta-lactamase n=1 Tax=Pseudochryseolinea flava TaxID=2059302 RepID=A0A364Y210_9BACT|nr:class A beta-lactamase, subclass A2 [Pseudochryseolinea flava]RAW00913.1 class A beta-lactamase, subclass A2 [Pseudochryseolinea flava]
MKKYAVIIVLLLLDFALATPLYAQSKAALKSKISSIVKSIDADIGVSMFHVEKKDTLSLQGTKHYPMQSIYKFHLALAILEQVDKGNIKLEKKVRIYPDQYFKTHSPIIKTYPEGNIDLSVTQLLEYTIIESDNLGCDLLFDLIGGPEKVNHFIHTLRIKDVSILNTEREMHVTPDLQFQNWTTPIAMSTLLREFYLRKVLQATTHDFLWTTLSKTSVGPRRIKGLLPSGTVVAHRTGTGDRDADGFWTAVNNAGIIVLPNGDHVVLSVFVTHLRGEIKDGESAIAEIAKAVYDHYAR